MQTNYSNISSLHERNEKIKNKFEIIFESFFVVFVFSEFLNMEKKSRGFIISDSLKKWTLKSLLSSGKRLILYSIFFLTLSPQSASCQNTVKNKTKFCANIQRTRTKL